MAKKRDPNSRPVGEPQRVLLERLDELGVDMKTASGWIGRNPAYMQQYIFRGTPQHLDEPDRIVLAQRTGLSEDTLDPRVRTFDRDDPGKVATFDRPKPEKVKILPYDGPALDPRRARHVPVYPAAQGGRGHHLITFDPIEYRPPDPAIEGVRGAYGILVTGESMIPAFRPGDIAWVHPHRPPARDEEVVLYHVPPAAEAEAIIKTLVRWTPRDWTLRQYQPPKEWDEPREDWPVCHLIVGKSRGR